MQSFAWRGVLAGWALFLALAGLTYLTPLREPVLRVAGSDYRALDARLRAADSGAPERLAEWRRLHATLSVFGFATWAFDLWPWLIGLGVALPAFGGVVGGQVPAGTRKRAEEPAPVAPDPSIPAAASAEEVAEPVPSTSPAPVQDEVAPPSGPASSWTWKAPAVARTSPRPKPPPVKSPHGDMEGGG